MVNFSVQSGGKIGRWTVLDHYEKTTKGEKKWLCRCECGTERYVLERSLKHGGSLSCGCLRKEAAFEAITHQLIGQTFGDLTVLEQADRNKHKFGVWWTCRCNCGRICDVQGTLLTTGKKTHCGCKTVKNQPFVDVTGQRFNRLLALYPTQQRDTKGSLIWHCRCDCGNELDISYNTLRYSNQQSCGCYRKELDRALGDHLNHVDGTSLEMIQSRKIPTNNTTGAKGVYLIKGLYVAKIVFQHKAYYLGSYKAIEDAISARKEAEIAIFDAAHSFYTAWQNKAQSDPEWANSNPVSFRVVRDSYDSLHLECSPNLK